MSSEHAQLFLLWTNRGPSNVYTQKRKLSLPNKVTNGSKGPLSLCGAEEASGKRSSKGNMNESPHLPPATQSHLTTHPHPSRRDSHLTTHPSSPRRESLTRYPVQLMEKPMDAVERELGTLSCTQLRDSLKVMHAISQHSLNLALAPSPWAGWMCLRGNTH